MIDIKLKFSNTTYQCTVLLSDYRRYGKIASKGNEKNNPLWQQSTSIRQDD
jgi:hypothetical protein